MNSLDNGSHVVVIGAGLAGWRLSETLRRHNFGGTLTVIGEESHYPYDRPPLSKQVLSGKWSVERTALVPSGSEVAASIEWRLGQRAISFDRATMTVHLDSGDSVRGSHIALCTGSRARRLRIPGSDHAHYLRTRDDLVRLEESMSHATTERPWIVVGAGFLGAEVATALVNRHVPVNVIESAAWPLVGVVGERAAQWLFQSTREFGVDVLTQRDLRAIDVDGDGLLLDVGGVEVPAAGVIAAVGSSLELEWLSDSGLRIDDGVVVDGSFQAAPGVAAIGDIARFPFVSGAGTESIRVEHWQTAVEQALRCAKYWLDGEPSTDTLVPYFWSDQYGKKIQMLGHPRANDDVEIVHGSAQSLTWLALYSRDDLVTGLLSLSQPRALMKAKILLERPMSRSEAFDLSPWSE